MNYIVVARYEKDITWLEDIQGWKKIVVQKRTDNELGDMPNEGREPGAFLHAIIKHYDKIRPTDRWVFVQDHPFDHCADLLQLMHKSFYMFEWLGGNTLKLTDGDGKQDHPNLPVAEYYTKWTGQQWTEGKQVSFAPGGQFIVAGEALLKRSKTFYKQMYKDVCNDWIAWCAERLWESVFTVNNITDSNTSTTYNAPITKEPAMSRKTANPTPNDKDYDGTMTKEEYAKQPESPESTIERDVDKPNPKTQPETLEEKERKEAGEMLVSDQIAERQRETYGTDTELTDEQKDQLRKKREIMEAEKKNPPEQQVLPQSQPLPQDAEEKHAAEVSAQQREKLDANPKVRNMQ